LQSAHQQIFAAGKTEKPVVTDGFSKEIARFSRRFVGRRRLVNWELLT
jgi:hypothetical protein